MVVGSTPTSGALIFFHSKLDIMDVMEGLINDLINVRPQNMLSPYILLGSLMFPNSPMFYALGWAAMGFGTIESFMYSPYLPVVVPVALGVHAGALWVSNRPPIAFRDYLMAAGVMGVYMAAVDWPYRIPRDAAIGALLGFISTLFFMSQQNMRSREESNQ